MFSSEVVSGQATDQRVASGLLCRLGSEERTTICATTMPS